MKGVDSFNRAQNITPQVDLGKTVKKSDGIFLGYHKSEVCPERECECSSLV